MIWLTERGFFQHRNFFIHIVLLIYLLILISDLENAISSYSGLQTTSDLPEDGSSGKVAKGCHQRRQVSGQLPGAV